MDIAALEAHEIDSPFGRVAVRLESHQKAYLTAGQQYDSVDAIVVNRIAYRLMLELRLRIGGVWGAGYDEALNRVDEPKRDASKAAEDRVKDTLTALFVQWVETNPGELVEARRRWLMNYRAQAQERVDQAQRRLDEAVADVAEVDAMLASLPPPVVTMTAEVDEDSVTF